MAGSGTASGFDSTLFRTSIHFAMNMGLPGQTSQQVTFIYNEIRTYDVEDPRDLPYNWTESTKTDIAQREVQVPVALQWAVGTVAADEMGQFDTSRAIVTLLDVDYATVTAGDVFPDGVEINGINYIIEAWAPPVGLFDVTVYSCTIAARG